jgi:hypothetical protein
MTTMSNARAWSIDQLLALWSDPAATKDDFRRCYTDPVRVNGTDLTVDALVARAGALRSALHQPQRTVLRVVDAEQAVSVAFELSGRHDGPLPTASAVLAPTGAEIRLRVIDILGLAADGRISDVTMVAEVLR